MPAERLPAWTRPIARFDVGGLDSPTAPNFVRHVGLISAAHDTIPSAGPLPLTHMAPPLRQGEPAGTVDALGSVPLRPDEIESIRIFLDKTAAEYEAQRIRRLAQYIVAPHVRPECEADGTVIFRRFSCAGLVLEAYREAEIDLLVTDPTCLPPVTLTTLATAYPDLEAYLRRPALRKEYGLESNEPWPVVLPGYLLNSLDRPEEAIRHEPHQPRTGDEYFPTREKPSEGPNR